MSATQQVLLFGVFELNLDTLELRKAGRPIKLPPQPCRLLGLLATHSGQIVTREEIQQQLWGQGTYVDFEHGMNKCIKQIRAALNDNADHPIYVETLPRHGYRFLAPVVIKRSSVPRPRVVESESGELSRVPVLNSAGAFKRLVFAEATAPSLAVADPEAAPDSSRTPATDLVRLTRLHLLWIALAAVMLIALIAAAVYWRAHSRPGLTRRDTVVLADFDNRAGDAGS